jgi:hypothetical protein
MAWDHQYELIESDPMRLNALLQSANYRLTCFTDGRIQSSTTGNQFSKCQYKGYDRKLQTYMIESTGQTFRIENRDGTIAKQRFTKFVQLLNQQRAKANKDKTNHCRNETPPTQIHTPLLSANRT